MYTQSDILYFFKRKHYDIRISGNGRWMDQKCAADVVSMIADCIYNYAIETDNLKFTSRDIWHYEYSINNIENVFKKPGVESSKAKNEYDKFFQQPMEMLAAAGVLSKKKTGVTNVYTIQNIDVLEFIAIREKNALYFLKEYILKSLSESGIMDAFEAFFYNPNKSTYSDVKYAFSSFTIDNTPINGETECNRIFIKILNPLAYFKNSHGTERGYLSKHIITYDMLMYNRNNFRDLYSEKPKDMTRKEYASLHPVEINEAYYKYQSSKARKFLRLFNDKYRAGKSEFIAGPDVDGLATQIHHIFPESDYTDICYYLENLIALTPTQHYNHAHPNGKTSEISEQIQHLLLLAKSDSIQRNLESSTEDKIYTFDNFLHILQVGFDKKISNVSNHDFSSIINVINRHYT